MICSTNAENIAVSKPTATSSARACHQSNLVRMTRYPEIKTGYSALILSINPLGQDLDRSDSRYAFWTRARKASTLGA